MGEFELIRKYFSSIGHLSSDEIGVGDDCFVLTPPPASRLACSIDTQLADVHFPSDAPADFIAKRALRCALSDLAAMGAEAHGFTLALSLPDVNESWLEAFSRGLREDAEIFGCALLGGDTTRGPLSITVQVHGWLRGQEVLLRGGAKAGDRVYISGTPGDAAAGLTLLDPINTIDPDDSKRLLDKYFFPPPRLALGQALKGVASACIDVSDGLLADLGHIARQSGLGAKINVDAVPLSAELLRYAGDQSLSLALAGGDDYELCFTAPPSNAQQVADVGRQLGIRITEIGEMLAGEGVLCFRESGEPFTADEKGYRHF